MIPYHKIENVLKRDPDTHKLIEGQYRCDEFEALAHLEWSVEEKVDGTNIRVMIDKDGIRYGGRTDNAQLHADLVQALRDMFEPRLAEWQEQFPDGVCLYGEGYGAGIQKIGKLYRPDKSFVMFDILCGGTWLRRVAVRAIGEDLGVEVAPAFMSMTLIDAIQYAASGFNSNWGDFEAEGLIARAPLGLKNRMGQRIITKIKTCDFARVTEKAA